MGAVPLQSTASVTRRDLAQNRFTWLATGGMVMFMAVSAAVMAFVLQPTPSTRLGAVAALAGVTAVVLLRSEPPPLGTRRNHGVIALPYLMTALFFWAYQPGGGAAVGGAIFISPLACVRLQNRRHIAAHLAAATVILSSVGLFGGVDSMTVLSILLVLPAMWVMSVSTAAVLEGTEAQGVELERLVRRDPLTGVGNRRLLDERLRDELRRHTRTQRPLSVLLLDLNGFKAVNDADGHAAGDQLLREVASKLELAAGPNDTVVRQGGDEFCLLLPETSPEQATRMATAVRACLASIGPGGVTTGIGLASFPDDAISSEVLMHVADERLRADKLAGPHR